MKRDMISNSLKSGKCRDTSLYLLTYADNAM